MTVQPAPPSATASNRKAGAAAAGGGGVGIVDAERRADQIVDEIDFRAGQERCGGGVDQDDRLLALDHDVVLGLRALDVELVLEAGAAAALDRDAQLGATALAPQNLADSAGSALADGDGGSHGNDLLRAGVMPNSLGILQHQ